jgi:hypothetical protein
MTSSPLWTRVLELTALFNQQSADLPNRLLHDDCVFRLNGRAYHEQLGRPASDPLVRLIGRGPAGYRFLLTRLRYAMAHPRLALDEATMQEQEYPDGRIVNARGTLIGTLRAQEGSVSLPCAVSVRASADGWVHELAVLIGDADVERIMAARYR